MNQTAAAIYPFPTPRVPPCSPPRSILRARPCRAKQRARLRIAPDVCVHPHGVVVWRRSNAPWPSSSNTLIVVKIITIPSGMSINARPDLRLHQPIVTFFPRQDDFQHRIASPRTEPDRPSVGPPPRRPSRGKSIPTDPVACRSSALTESSGDEMRPTHHGRPSGRQDPASPPEGRESRAGMRGTRVLRRPLPQHPRQLAQAR